MQSPPVTEPSPDGSPVDTATPSTVPATTQRRDLNGLRGLAIGLVVLFHVWFGRVSGGVDVFLVLSGYFFVGSLVRRVEAGGSLNPLPALRRVFLRLFPLIAAVAVLTAVASAVLLPRTRWSVMGDQLIAVLGFFQNWQLAITASDYLAADGSVTPLQHMWSMAVQGQFYVFAIALVLAVGFVTTRVRVTLLRPTLAVVLTGLVIGSFVYAHASSVRHQTWAYYDSGARLWELALGALAAVLLTSSRTARVASWPLWIRSVLGVVGLAAILSCGVLLDGAQQFPGPWALVPVLATIALILAGTGVGPWTSTVLAHPALTWLGSIAFALYLVHWPILVFTLVVTGRPTAGPVVGALVIVASVLLALALRRIVEVPVDRGGRSRTIAVGLCLLLVVAALAGTFGWQSYASSQTTGNRAVDSLDVPTHPGALTLTDGYVAPNAPMVPSIFDAPHDLPASTLDGCIADFTERKVIHCTYGDRESDRSIALAGGSHSEHWLTALDQLGEEHGFRVDTYLKMGCPLNIDYSQTFTDYDYPDCVDWSRGVLDTLAQDKPDYVFTTASRPNPEGPGDVTPESYIHVWEELEGAGIDVLAIRDTPWLHHDGVPYRAIDCLDTTTSPDTCAMPRDEMLSEVNPAIAAIENLTNVRLLDLSDGVCDPDLCRVIVGNVLVYHDTHHLTASYVRTLSTELGRQLSAQTRWW
ncbi:peptidoglycan/LPS O-acetylase OafA/YrhL [Rhodococcus sp. 27YEA15]|uniref:acyltransferase family protein n=1 Tax=Rhodococcus sp. 27YEA15 TaxID=3156259 RepID=UPI003C7BB610